VNDEVPAATEPPYCPESFLIFKDLIRIHLTQILKLDSKPPMAAVALLVAVACETLSRLLGYAREDEVFARQLMAHRDVPYPVAQVLFSALRNGYAHQYRANLVDLDGSDILITLTWKEPGLHLRIVGVENRDGHLHPVPLNRNQDKRARLIVDVESLWKDLDALITRVEGRLVEDQALAGNVDANWQARIRKEREKPVGDAATAWRKWVFSQTWNE